MIDVVMPQMGESIVEGTLTKWLKKPGERVERDEPLFEISTDKVDTEIPSPAAGVLQDLLVEEGQTVAINTVVARIADEGGASAAPAVEQPAAAQPPAAAAPPEPAQAPPPPPPQPQAAPPPPAPAQATDEELGPLSPVVRKIAREHNIDLRQVRGTGAGGRITKADVEGYVQGGARPAPPPQAPAPTQAPPRSRRRPLQPRCLAGNRPRLVSSR